MKASILTLLLIALGGSVATGQPQMPAWFPDDGARMVNYRAGTAGTGLLTFQFEELLGTKFNYVGYFLVCVYDAGGAGAAPQGEIREVTGFTLATGVVTVTTAFTQASDGDIFVLLPSPTAHALMGTQGVPAVTATKLAAGVNLAEGSLYDSNVLDSLAGALYGDVGAQWGTATEPANGVDLFEGLGFAQNQLDSIVGSFYGDVGLQWGTATEPAAGVAFDEGVHFLQNQADSIAGALYGNVGAQWGTATEPANGVNLFEGLGFAQNQLDSLVGALYGNVGLQWGAAAQYANGVAVDEVIASIQDLLDSIRVELWADGGIAVFPAAEAPANGVPLAAAIRYATDATDSLEGALYGDVGAQWGTATEPANGVDLFEGLGYLQNQADSLEGALYGDVGLQWGSATEPANGVSLDEGIHFMQNQSDSLVGALYGDVGLQWGTAAVAANGVAMDEVVRYIQQYVDSVRADMWGDAGIAVYPAAEAPANGVPLAASVRAAYNSAEGSRVAAVQDSSYLLQLVGGTSEVNVWLPPVRVIVDFAAAGAWEEAATTHELFTITGDGDYEISGYCSTLVATTSSDSLWLFMGDAGATGFRIASFLGEDIDAGENLFPLEPVQGQIATASQLSVKAGHAWKGTIFGGADIGYDIDDNDFVSGILVLYCRFRPISDGSSAAAGAGGGL